MILCKLQVYNIVIHNFESYTPFIVIIKHWLYSLCCTVYVTVTALVAQSCLTLCHPTDYIACQASLSIEFFRPEYWSELPFPSPEELPYPEIEPWAPALQADSLPFELQGSLQYISL